MFQLLIHGGANPNMAGRNEFTLKCPPKVRHMCSSCMEVDENLERIDYEPVRRSVANVLIYFNNQSFLFLDISLSNLSNSPMPQ